MKQHLNTLFVTTEGSYLRKEGQAVVVRVKKETRLRVPLHNLDGIVCFGRVGCSPPLMGACAQAGVTISLLNAYGGFQAAIVGFSPGNVLLRRTQYRLADDEEASAVIACNVVAAKIANCRSVLLRTARESSEDERREALDGVARRLANIIPEARQATNLGRIRGVEDDAANHYYLKLIGPVAIYDYGLSTREGVLAELQELLDRHQTDPGGFAASLLPKDTAEREVRGPDCA